MQIVFGQILIILLYVLIGYIAGKCGLVNPDQRKYLTKICTDLIMPFTVLSAVNQNITPQQMAHLGLILILLLAFYGTTTGISLIIQGLLHVPYPVKTTTASLLTYPNRTFLGLPLCLALFGEIAILYNAVALIAFNVLFFTWQYDMFTAKKFNIHNLITPPTIATVVLILMLALGLRFPQPVHTVISNTGSMISPLSLIIIGVMMSENKMVMVLKERKAYLICLVRNICIPLLYMLVLKLLPFQSADKLCLLVYMACPCATLTTIYAIQNDMEPELAAHSVLMSTILFSVSLPLIVFIGTHFL